MPNGLLHGLCQFGYLRPFLLVRWRHSRGEQVAQRVSTATCTLLPYFAFVLVVADPPFGAAFGRGLNSSGVQDDGIGLGVSPQNTVSLAQQHRAEKANLHFS